MGSGSTSPNKWRKVDATGAAYLSALTGVSQSAFPEVPDGGIRERMISNPSLTSYIYINLTGDAAVANGAGTTPLAPLDTLFTETTNAVTVIGTSGQAITVRER